MRPFFNEYHHDGSSKIGTVAFLAFSLFEHNVEQVNDLSVCFA